MGLSRVARSYSLAALLVGIVEPNTYAESADGAEPIFTSLVGAELLVFVISVLCLVGIGVGAAISAVSATLGRRARFDVPVGGG